MWTLRAAVRRGAALSRAVRGRPTLRVAPPPLPPGPGRALAALSPGDPGGLQGRRGGVRGPRADGRSGGAGAAGEEEDAPEDAENEEEEEELLRSEPLLPAGAQRVCLVHPEVKWGPGKPQLTRGEPARGCGRAGGAGLRGGASGAGLQGPTVGGEPRGGASVTT